MDTETAELQAELTKLEEECRSKEAALGGLTSSMTTEEAEKQLEQASREVGVSLYLQLRVMCVCVCVCVFPAEYGFTRLSSPSLSLGGYQQPNVYVCVCLSTCWEKKGKKKE